MQSGAIVPLKTYGYQLMGGCGPHPAPRAKPVYRHIMQMNFHKDTVFSLVICRFSSR
jgi:hypothetical protein